MTVTLPQHPISASIKKHNNGKVTLTLERQFPHPIEKIWIAITKVHPVSQWTPFAPDRPMNTPGPITLKQTDGSGYVAQGMITEMQTPYVLAFTWGTDPIRMELKNTNGETHFKFQHTIDDKIAQTAAGWHICLQALDYLLAGNDVPEVHGLAAKSFGFDSLVQAYSEMPAFTDISPENPAS